MSSAPVVAAGHADKVFRARTNPLAAVVCTANPASWRLMSFCARIYIWRVPDILLYYLRTAASYINDGTVANSIKCVVFLPIPRPEYPNYL